MIIVKRNTIPQWVSDEKRNRASSRVINRSTSRNQSQFETDYLVGTGKTIPIVYGKYRVPGKTFVAGTYTLSIKYLLFAMAWGQGEIESIDEIFLDGLNRNDWEASGHTWPSGPAYLATPVTDSVFVNDVESFLGTASQASPFTLRRAGLNPSLFSFGDYTDTNQNIAYSCFQFDPRDELASIPKIEAVVKGIKIFDPRTGLTEWSPNAALILADYINRYSEYSIDYTSVIDAANWCSEDVTTGLQATSIEIENYDPKVRNLIGLSVSDALVNVEEQIQILADYAGCFAIREGGTYYLVPDRPGTSVKSYDQSSIKDLTVTIPGGRSLPTIVRVNYTQATNSDWIPDSVETPIPVSNILRREVINLPYYLNAGTANRYAIQRLNKINLSSVEIQFSLFSEGLQLRIGDIIDITHDYGFSASLFRVTNISSPRKGFWQISASFHSDTIYSNEVQASPSYVDKPIPESIPSDFITELSKQPYWAATQDRSIQVAINISVTSSGMPYDLGEYFIQPIVFESPSMGSLDPGPTILLGSLIATNNIVLTGFPESFAVAGGIFDIDIEGRLTRDSRSYGSWSQAQSYSVNEVDLDHPPTLSGGGIRNPDGTVRYQWLGPSIYPNVDGLLYEVREVPSNDPNDFDSGTLLGTTDQNFIDTDFLFGQTGIKSIYWKLTHTPTNTTLGIRGGLFPLTLPTFQQTDNGAIFSSSDLVTTTSFQNIPNLFLDLKRGKKYRFELMLLINTNGNTGSSSIFFTTIISNIVYLKVEGSDQLLTNTSVQINYSSGFRTYIINGIIDSPTMDGGIMYFRIGHFLGGPITVMKGSCLRVFSDDGL